MIELFQLDWTVCDFLLTMGIVASFGYLLLYIIEATNEKLEDYNYTEYVENKERQNETRCGSESCEYSKED